VPDDQIEDKIAVIGMAVRLPDADTPAAYWQAVLHGRPAVRFFDDAADGRVPAWAALDGVEYFDAPMFGYAPREAALLDPQQRVLLECAWHALEDAGYASEAQPNPVGVYVSSSISTYLLRHLIANPAVQADYDELILFNDKDSAATRLSYHLNLEGPAVAVQSACSSSLVAVHLACQALLARDCDMALAGGVSIQLPQRGYRYQPGGILSPDGRCLPFDVRAQGVVPGSGAAIIVLKPLTDALRDRDNIWAVILASTVNNDGATKVGFTAPRAESQATVALTAQHLAMVDAESIGYVEAHGTGTALGDPIEVSGLTRAFRASTSRTGYCALGSVKALIGHLDAAAGVAGLVKAVLAVQAGIVPPSPYLEQPNPRLELDSSPFYLPREPTPWPGSTARRAAVASVGMGGTNAHVLLEQAPEVPATPADGAHIIPVSARTADALAELRSKIDAALPAVNTADAAWTLQVGRRRLRHRSITVYQDGVPVGPTHYGESDAQDTPVIFMFPGQGSQHPGMAADLYHGEPMFRREFDRVARLADPDPVALLYGGQPASREELALTGNAQVALFAVEYALAHVWLSWGIQPAAMIGHSVGEFVAACLAGVFDLGDAVRLVGARARAMQRLPGGAMVAVGMPADELTLPDGVALAADNAPASCVVAGNEHAVTRFVAGLSAAGIPCRRLQVSHAFHSPMMEPMLDAFADLVAAVPRRGPSIPYLSSLTGDWVTSQEGTDPRYWARHASQPVRFRQGARILLDGEPRILAEVGPGNTLCSLVREHGPAAAAHTLLSSHLDPVGLRAALGKAWIAGARIDWAGVAEYPRRRISLPGYPFARQRHWIPARGQVPHAEPSLVPPEQSLPASPRLAADEGDEVERQLTRIWRDMLGLAEIQPDDNFFELGGHSLLGVRMVARINQTLGVDLLPGALFDAPTVAELTVAVWRQLAAHAELVAEVSELTPDQVRAALEETDQ
jgi:acyl transferase domain-containing protein